VIKINASIIGTISNPLLAAYDGLGVNSFAQAAANA